VFQEYLLPDRRDVSCAKIVYMNSKTQNIIDSTFTMSLATNGVEGIWVADVIYVTDGVTPALYWISSSNTKHSKAIESNPECAIAITLTQKAREHKAGLQMQGFAHEVQGDMYGLTCKHAEKQRLPKPVSVDSYCNGDIWYVFYPYLVEIFDEDAKEKETVVYIDKKRVTKMKLETMANGYPCTYLWFDMPKYEYPLHSHRTAVEHVVMRGDVTFKCGGESVRVGSTGLKGSGPFNF